MLHFYMQIKPESIYMEEDGTSNVEFPVAGQFHLASTSRFKVCGDPATSGSVEERRSPWGSLLQPFPAGHQQSTEGQRKMPLISGKKLVKDQAMSLFSNEVCPSCLCLLAEGQNHLWR